MFNNIERFRFRGGSGNDQFFGGNLNDTLIGGAGNDTLNGVGGVDSLDGGAGIDTLVDADFSTATTALNFNISGTTTLGTITLPNSSTIKGFELFTNVKGGSGDDLICITSPTRVINNLQGGAGNDTLNPGLGYDTVDGGSGFDVLEIDYSILASTISQFVGVIDGRPELRILTTANYISYSNIESFNFKGGSGNDRFFGGDFNDTLTGNQGNDSLIGGAGNDSLTGGSGADRFTFNNFLEGIDTITDFSSAQADKIVLNNLGFGGLARGNLEANQLITVTELPIAITVTQRFIYNTTNGALFFDADGSGVTAPPIQIATLTGAPTLMNSDIVIV